jgi:hypothetical protein
LVSFVAKLYSKGEKEKQRDQTNEENVVIVVFFFFIFFFIILILILILILTNSLIHTLVHYSSHNPYGIGKLRILAVPPIINISDSSRSYTAKYDFNTNENNNKKTRKKEYAAHNFAVRRIHT